MTYRKFKLKTEDLKNLSSEERKVLVILEDVVKDIDEVYKLQLKDGFYPKDITKEKLEKASIKNPAINSPFTYIYEEDGLLKTIPYHLKYADLLTPIAQKIEKAAAVSTNQSSKNYLKARARSLLDGSYNEADIAWFSVKNSKIDFSIGPFERYLDKVLFLKRVFQAHVGVIDEKLTKLSEEIKETLYASAKTSYNKHHSTDIPQKGVEVFVEETPATGGFIADIVFSGEHFPSDLHIMKKYGSKIIIYSSHLKLKFEKLHYPIFKTIFEKRFAAKYSKEVLLRAIGWNILLYESSRQLHKFAGARERLKELYGSIDEANGGVSGIQHAKYLVVKGLISQDELEAIIIIHIVRMFSEWVVSRQNAAADVYLDSFSIVLNRYLKSEALKEQNGISWPNFSKIFFEIENLAEELVHLLEEGSYREVEKFIKENSDPNVFDKLGQKIKDIPFSL